MGDMEQANQDVSRLYSAFTQRTSQWEIQARNLEQQLKMQAARNPRSVSIEKMNQMKSEQTAVRTRIRTAEVHFRRLHQGLEQAFTIHQRQPTRSVTEELPALPAEFLASFNSAPIAERPAIIKRFFEIETVVKVSVGRGAKAAYDIRFVPSPPIDRLYFLTAPAQIIQLLKLGSKVLVLDLAAGRKTELTLVEFVKHIQNGAWLLRSR
jgi:hypothetical protein